MENDHRDILPIMWAAVNGAVNKNPDNTSRIIEKNVDQYFISMKTE